MHHPASLVSACVFLIIALVHLVRMLLGVTVVVNSVTVPLWPSGLAFVLLALLAFWILAERRPRGGP